MCVHMKLTLFLEEVFLLSAIARGCDEVATDCCLVSQATIRRGEETTSLPGSFWQVLTLLSFRTSR